MQPGLAESSPVHPRVRGERKLPCGVFRADVGSSPRARGTLEAPSEACAHVRFIPACAGNAPLRPTPEPASTVHPRVRGERYHQEKQAPDESGSSPRARGTLGISRGILTRRRFIPACAGNAYGLAATPALDAVHPRVRGERYAVLVGPIRTIGSSPRARGTHRIDRLARLNRRFIPACAGNAIAVITPLSAATVHPRVRGERHS